MAAPARPQWLVRASSSDQLHYGELEQQLLNSQLELEKQLGRNASARHYARSVAAQALELEFGSKLDPDSIMTSSRYVFEVQGRKFIQEDNRSLTDLLLCGQHESGHQATVTFHGNGLPSEVNQRWFEANLAQSVRVNYGVELRDVYQRGDVLAAMTGVTRDRLLLSAFGARLQDHLSEVSLQRVRRAVAGDASLTINPLQLRDDNRPFKDMLVIGNHDGSDKDDWLLYAPGSPEGQDWHQKPSFRVLSLDIGAWTAEQMGRDYLTWQTHALDRDVIGSYLKKIPPLPQRWEGVEVAPNPYTGHEVLNAIVFNLRAWLISQEESQTPYGYRSADDAQRGLYARVNCELKALQTVGIRQCGFVNYEQFCRDLIKARVEQVLSERGEQVTINPDRIYVEISQDQKMTLTQLIVNEVHFYADSGTPGTYPRYSLAIEHPATKKLDIRDISSWSKTLRPGEKYIDMLRSDYLAPSHPQGRFKRQIHLETSRLKMRIAILQGSFNGRLLKHHADELLNVVDQLATLGPAPQSPLGETPGEVRYSALFNLHLKERLVTGVFVFRLFMAGSVEEYLYTPDAPDGRELRPFKDFVASVKSGVLGDYLYDRVAVKFQPQVGTYLTDLEEVSRFTEAPFLKFNSRIRDFNKSYDDVILKVIADVDEKTTSLNEIITGLVFDAVVAAASTISIVFPPVGIALSVVLFNKELVQGFEAYGLGDRATALSHFKDALLELVTLSKAGLGGSAATPLQKSLIDLLGDAREIESLFCAVTGQTGLEDRVRELIQEILDDSESSPSKTTLV